MKKRRGHRGTLVPYKKKIENLFINVEEGTIIREVFKNASINEHVTSDEQHDGRNGS
jgi:hypothetical protein